MRIDKLSASAIKTYGFCEFKYYLTYVAGLEDLSGKAAVLGTICHGALASIARKPGRWDWERCLQAHWDHNVYHNPRLDIRKINRLGLSADWKKCVKALDVVRDSAFNPDRLKVIDVENKFRFHLKKKKWQTQSGEQLRLSGIIDLVHELDDDTIEIIDWKTGQQKDFGSGKEINNISILSDIQPRMYHLAACYLYPQYTNIYMTFYYMLQGGPVIVCLGKDDIPETLDRIHHHFKTMENNNRATRIKPHWKCKMCAFSKSGICDTIWESLR